MSSRANPGSQHEGQGQTGAQQGHQGGQQGGGAASGPPTNEQLLQFMMIAKGMTRETAGEALAADPDSIKAQFQKVKQLMQQ